MAKGVYLRLLVILPHTHKKLKLYFLDKQEHARVCETWICLENAEIIFDYFNLLRTFFKAVEWTEFPLKQKSFWNHKIIYGP